MRSTLSDIADRPAWAARTTAIAVAVLTGVMLLASWGLSEYVDYKGGRCVIIEVPCDRCIYSLDAK